MNLLVTGAAGFIGSNFVHYLLGRNPNCTVVALDKLTYAGNLDNFTALSAEHRQRFRFHRGEIADSALVDQLFDQHDFEAVINFAAESHVDRSIHDPQLFLKTNVLGTQTLMDVCRRRWKTTTDWRPNVKFVQISTDEVYGSLGPEGLFTEASPLRPNNPYSASKAAADLLVLAYHHTYRLPAVITRCSNNYGPYQFPEKLIPLMIRNALRHEELPVYGDGRHVRDWLFVEDHCRAVDLVRERAEPGTVYNIGGNNERENIAMVRTILSTLRERTKDEEINEGLLRHVPDRPGHDRRYGIDAGKIRSDLGWTPLTNLEEGLTQTIDWYLGNRDWCERVISGDYLNFYEKNYKDR